MRTRAILRGVLGACVWAVRLGGCATAPPRESLSEPRAPADPLYRHRLQTPRGGWDFQLGGGYEPSDR